MGGGGSGSLFRDSTGISLPLNKAESSLIYENVDFEAWGKKASGEVMLRNLDPTARTLNPGRCPGTVSKLCERVNATTGQTAKSCRDGGPRRTR